MSALLADPQTWLALITLSLLEIVLGFDNIIFISLLVGRLRPARQEAARIAGLTLAMLTRIALLFSVVWLTSLVQPPGRRSQGIVAGLPFAAEPFMAARTRLCL